MTLNTVNPAIKLMSGSTSPIASHRRLRSDSSKRVADFVRSRSVFPNDKPCRRADVRTSEGITAGTSEVGNYVRDRKSDAGDLGIPSQHHGMRRLRRQWQCSSRLFVNQPTEQTSATVRLSRNK